MALALFNGFDFYGMWPVADAVGEVYTLALFNCKNF